MLPSLHAIPSSARSPAAARLGAQEFEEGWDFLVETMVEETADKLGVSSTSIFLACAGITLWLLALFAFLYLALSAWYSSGSFQSTIQSLFICVSGLGSKALRKKASAEDATSIDNAVKMLMGESTSPASAAAGPGPRTAAQ